MENPSIDDENGLLVMEIHLLVMENRLLVMENRLLVMENRPLVIEKGPLMKMVMETRLSIKTSMASHTDSSARSSFDPQERPKLQME